MHRTAMIEGDVVTTISHGEETAMASASTWWRRLGRQLGRDSAYTLTALPLVVAAFVLVTVLVSVGDRAAGPRRRPAASSCSA